LIRRARFGWLSKDGGEGNTTENEQIRHKDGGFPLRYKVREMGRCAGSADLSAFGGFILLRRVLGVRSRENEYLLATAFDEVICLELKHADCLKHKTYFHLSDYKTNLGQQER